jgi:L-lactate dehydrogenase complex protein LldG
VSDREAILARIRAAAPGAIPHPGVYAAPTLPAGVEEFAGALRRAGGEALGPLPRAALGAAVLERARRLAVSGRLVLETGAAEILAPGAAEIFGPGGFEVAPAGAAPGSFADVGLAVAAGFVGVAESGAVAVLGRDAPHRSLLVLAERLCLLLYAGHLVGDLHAGMRALPAGALDAHHVTWIAGPSKSADIEQTLVLGAHGPRSLVVFLYA